MANRIKGITLEISGGPATNPTIYNSHTDEYMQIQGEVKEGDRIIITTKTGNKTVTLEREGVTTNIRYNPTTFIPIRIK
ncbi:MAG: hypothetical protein Q4D76_18260 [Oscillospiraceae bacterium]|nr:hypothetical protein [Oscillospiraceae bacterium]